MFQRIWNIEKVILQIAPVRAGTLRCALLNVPTDFGILRKEFWLVNLLLMLVNQLVMVIRTRRLLLVNKLIIVKPLGIHSLLVVNKLESLIITTLDWV